MLGLKLVRFAAGTIFVLILPLFLVSTNIRLLANQPRLYQYAFDKYGAEGNVGLDKQELAKVANAIPAYFSSPEMGPLFIDVVRGGKPFPLFSEKEAVHMQDVKGLIRLATAAQAGLLLYIFLYAALLWLQRIDGFWSTLVTRAAAGALLTLVALAAFGLVALFGFSQLFLLFHQLSFSNQLWILDPRTDNLIRLFPEEFFFDVTLLFTAMTIVEALLLVGLAVAIRTQKPRMEVRDTITSI